MGRPPASPAAARNGPDRYVFIELNVSRQLGSIRLFVAATSAMLLVVLAILCLLIVYSRKLAAYREREQSMANLVQLGEAARTLAHEIKNPLGVIRVQCATLARTLPEERQKNIRVIQEETERLVQLTDRVRDFLHNSAGSPKPCDAAGFLEQCRVRYADRLLVSRWNGSAVTINVDPDRMMQVLDNLVVNAIEATESAGKAATVPVLSLSVQKGRALFSVADRGSGVDPENRDRLFELFFTTKPRGSGIGLALSRRFMEQAGGSLEYAEQTGGGSVFTASVPCAASSRRR
jgi:two-component system sensor histidine kinase HydH